MIEILTITKKQLIFYIVWIIVLILSLLLFSYSLHIIPSLILFILNLILCIYGFIYTSINRNIYFFSPIFQIMYCILFYCGLIGLFYFSKFNNIPFFSIPTNNESLLISISLVYFLFCICTLTPYLIMKCLKKRININLDYFKRNFVYNRLINYLIYSEFLILFFLIILFYVTGFNLYTALLNPLKFRFAYNHGFAGFIYTVISLLLKLNLCIILKYVLIDKLKTLKFRICTMIFAIFYIVWFILSGSRSWILLPFLYGIYIYTFQTFLRINLKKILVIVLAAIISISLAALYFLYRNYQEALNSKRFTSNREFNIITSSIERIDNFSNSVHYFYYIDRKYGSIWNYSDFNYIKQITSQITNIIPRTIIPDKGYPISGELTRIIFPSAWNGNVNLIFGGIVDLFYTGGIFFLIFDSLLFGLFVALLQFNYKKLINYDFFIVNYIVIFLDIPVMYFAIGLINTAIINAFIAKSILMLLITFILSKRILNIKGCIQE